MTAYTSHGLPIIETTVDAIEELPLDINDLSIKANTAFSNVHGRVDALQRRVIPDGANVDDYRTDALKGSWYVASGARAATMTGAKPFGDYPFMLDVVYLNSAAWQIAYPGGSGDYTAAKLRKYSPLSPAIGWTAWKAFGDLWAKDLYSGNLDDLKTPGMYPIGGNTAGAPTTDAANVWVTPNVPAGNWRQEVVTRMPIPRTFIRVTALSGWNPWVEQTNANEYNDPVYGYHSRDRRDKVVEKAARRVGKRIGTGGRAAVAITYDHGFANFRDKVLPIHRELGLPCTVAVNTATLNANDNLGVSYPELQAWALNDGVELSNHSRDHDDATTKAGIADKILGSLVLMRDNMPLVSIDSYIMPGVSGTQYAGFNGGQTDEAFFEKEAGRIILDNHAVVTGLIPGTLLPLTGTPNFGASRAAMDTGSFVTEAQNLIAQAVGQGAGVIVYMHPIYLDQADRTTTERLRGFLEFVAGYRDSGDLDVLSLTGFGFADSGHSERSNLLVNGNFKDGLAGWANTAGWSTATGGLVTYATTTTGTPLTQTVSLDRRQYYAGGARELVYRVRATTGATARTSVAGTNLSAAKDHVLPASPDWVEVRKPLTIPTDATGLDVAVGRVAGGQVDVANIRIQSI